MSNGQECKILWLRKKDVLRPFVDLYAMDSHQHLKIIVVPTNMYSIIIIVVDHPPMFTIFIACYYHLRYLLLEEVMFVLLVLLLVDPTWCMHNVVL